MYHDTVAIALYHTHFGRGLRVRGCRTNLLGGPVIVYSAEIGKEGVCRRVVYADFLSRRVAISSGSSLTNFAAYLRCPRRGVRSRRSGGTAVDMDEPRLTSIPSRLRTSHALPYDQNQTVFQLVFSIDRCFPETAGDAAGGAAVAPAAAAGGGAAGAEGAEDGWQVSGLSSISMT